MEKVARDVQPENRKISALEAKVSELTKLVQGQKAPVQTFDSGKGRAGGLTQKSIRDRIMDGSETPKQLEKEAEWLQGQGIINLG